MIKYFNNNPKNVQTQDCAIRSLSMFLQKDYYEVVDDLTNVYKQTGFHIADPVCFNLYLQSFNKYMQTDVLYPNTLSLKDMCSMLEYKDFSKLPNINIKNYTKILALLNNTHLTFLNNCVIIDTWNCENLNVQSYYVERS